MGISYFRNSLSRSDSLGVGTREGHDDGREDGNRPSRSAAAIPGRVRVPRLTYAIARELRMRMRLPTRSGVSMGMPRCKGGWQWRRRVPGAVLRRASLSVNTVVWMSGRLHLHTPPFTKYQVNCSLPLTAVPLRRCVRRKRHVSLRWSILCLSHGGGACSQITNGAEAS